MAESPSQSPQSQPQPHPDPQTQPPVGGSSLEYWCYHCEKRVSVETLANVSDVICSECKNGFVESLPSTSTLSLSFEPTPQPSSSDHQLDDRALSSQFLQVLRLIAHAAREEGDPSPPPPPPPPSNPPSEDDFLRIEFDGWDEEEEEEEERDDDVSDLSEQERNEVEESGGRNVEVRSNDENRGLREGFDDGDDEDARRRRRDVLRMRIRDLTSRARSGRNRILDWAEILMGLDDNSIELRLEVPESDRFIGNPEDYIVDDAGYQALLQNLAENDSGRRGAPPAAKYAVAELQKVEVKEKDEVLNCAVCKEMVSVGDMATKMPCGHGYHGDCIVPWLGARNTCPVCRYELPTDDAEYEEKRKRFEGGPSRGGGGEGGGGNDLDSGVV